MFTYNFLKEYDRVNIDLKLLVLSIPTRITFIILKVKYMINSPQKVVVTGAAGHISYSLLFRIANGDLLGKNQSIILQLLDTPEEKVQNALRGIVMELYDCAFPLLTNITIHSSPVSAFQDANIVFLIGAQPRSLGMERKDLLRKNAEIFAIQGKALNTSAAHNVKVLVVGNPVNTNAYIAMQCAPNLSIHNFTAMLRLDHNRALAQLAHKINKPILSIDKLCVWGNHSPTMYPDYRFATIHGKLIKNLIIESTWNQDTFLPTVSTRGTEIIKKRGLSSAASAANAAIDHMRDWIFGTNGRWTTMGVPSNGSYGIPEGIIFGFPVTIEQNGEYHIVENLEIDKFSQEKIHITLNELLKELNEVNYLFH